MSGDSYHFGDRVDINGGAGHIGVVKGNVTQGAAPQASADLAAAIRELLVQVERLRGQVSSVTAQAIDDSLADIDGQAGAPPEERHRALMAVAGIAATVGAIGLPVLEAVNRILELLGVR